VKPSALVSAVMGRRALTLAQEKEVQEVMKKGPDTFFFLFPFPSLTPSPSLKKR
jgi:hypothetical protein